VSFPSQSVSERRTPAGLRSHAARERRALSRMSAPPPLSRPTTGASTSSGGKIIIVSQHEPAFAAERHAAMRGPPPERPGSAKRLTPLNLDQLSRGARPGTPLTMESPVHAQHLPHREAVERSHACATLRPHLGQSARSSDAPPASLATCRTRCPGRRPSSPPSTPHAP
jgi:hypothetical protein